MERLDAPPAAAPFLSAPRLESSLSTLRSLSSPPQTIQPLWPFQLSDLSLSPFGMAIFFER